MIYNTDFKETIENAFLTYGASVAQERSIMDVRDCLKIGLRQGLYAQFTNGLTSKNKFQKAQKSVAAAMSQSYVHGDAAMYDTLIRAAKPWAYRYPIEDVQGAYGNPTAPDTHSASRYVEMKAGSITDYIFEGLKRDAVKEWYMNYDDTELIPSVMPSVGFWNLVNGCSGIAVAMTTSVPQFNLVEVNNALAKIIKNPAIAFDDIYCVPDFAQGGTIINPDEVKEGMRTGKDAVVRVRAKLTYNLKENMIQATEMPPGVYTNTVIQKLGTLTDSDPNYGIERVVDHTKETADIRIYLSDGVAPQKMIARLYKDTPLESSFAINMVMLDMGRFPKVFGWREACDAYIAHCRSCVRNSTQYDLGIVDTRLHIVEGLITATGHLDDIIRFIRKASSDQEILDYLASKYKIDKAQGEAILAIKLSSLSKTDATKLRDEESDLKKEKARLEYVLATPSEIDDIIIERLEEVSKRYGDKRRTGVASGNVKEIEVDEDEATELDAVLYSNGMVRFTEPATETGKKGRPVGAPPKGANAVCATKTTSRSSIIFFSNVGKMYEFDTDGKEAGTDYSVFDLVEFQDKKERPIFMMDSNEMAKHKWVIIATKSGYIKRSDASEYVMKNRQRGAQAIKLANGDSIVSAFYSDSEDDKIVVVANTGLYNYYPVSELTSIGRTCAGVHSIKLGKDEYVSAACLILDGVEYGGILTVSESGRGKISKMEEYPMTSRVVKGNISMKLDKNESIAVFRPFVKGTQSFTFMVGNKKTVIKESALAHQGRATQGSFIVDNREAHNRIEVI